MTRDREEGMHRVLPPPVVVLGLAVAMWLIGQLPGVTLPSFPGQTFLAVAIAGLGLTVMGLAVWQFYRGGTSVNPMAPEAATALVSRGIYRYSRNPMYLGDLLLLAAWTVQLGAPLDLAVLAGFVWYMNRFQIRPEEAALTRHFGDVYRHYCAQAPRWFAFRKLLPGHA